MAATNRIRDIMTPDPAVCTPDTSIQEVARMMVDFDCGSIPVMRADDDDTPVGTVTDRDIVCRLVANGRNPLVCRVRDCMTTPCVTCRDDADVNEARDLMKQHRVRRLVVVDQSGKCCGVVAMADIVRALGDIEVVRRVSERVVEAAKMKGKVPEPA